MIALAYSWGLILGAASGFFVGALYGPRLISRIQR